VLDAGASFWLPPQAGTIKEREINIVWSYNGDNNRVGLMVNSSRTYFPGGFMQAFESMFRENNIRVQRKLLATDEYDYDYNIVHNYYGAIDETKRYKLRVILHVNGTSATVIAEELDGGLGEIFNVTTDDIEMPGNMINIRALETTTIGYCESVEVLEET